MKNLVTKIARGIALVSLTAVVAGGAGAAPQVQAAELTGMAAVGYPSGSLAGAGQMADLALTAMAAARALQAAEPAEAKIAEVAEAMEQASDSAISILAERSAANEDAVNESANSGEGWEASIAPEAAQRAAK